MSPTPTVFPDHGAHADACAAALAAGTTRRPSFPPPAESSGAQAARKVLVAASLYPDDCVRGIARFAREHDWHLVTDMLVTGALPRGWSGSGVLALAPYPSEWLAHVLAARLPCVACGSAEPTNDVPRVQPDHAAIGRLAADHLLERGHRHFAWAPFLNDAANRDRLAGYQARLAECGASCRIFPPMHTRVGPYWQDNWLDQRRSLVAELQKVTRPLAVFAFNDCAALNVMDACRDAGLAVPEDVAVLGAGNTLLCDIAPVPLSSIDEDIGAMGYRAAQMLDRLLRRQGVEPVVLIPPRGVVARVSTGVLAVADSRVARALHHIAENYHDPMLTVCAVAEAVGTSRRNLERSFREATGCTINDQIVRVRMEEASRLLKTYPRTRTTDVAALVGINDAGTFCRTFRRYFGVNPQAHREWSAPSAGVTPQASFRGAQIVSATPTPSPLSRS